MNEETDGKAPVPVTVFTGYLGAGKTSIIKNLVRRLPKDYNVAWLKNEFGDMEVDSEVAKDSHIAVKEIMNGCLCCVLVGQMNEALKEIVENQNPSRIIIETSGSAYPAPIAWEIRKMDFLQLDGIVTVIDALNFSGYEDKSYTARIQSQYTDLIVVNKHELVEPGKLETTLDDVHDLNPTTPKIHATGPDGIVEPGLVFGLDTKLFASAEEVEVLESGKDDQHHGNEVDILQAKLTSLKVFDRKKFEDFLGSLDPEDVYRAKGLVCLTRMDVDADSKFVLFNFVGGRHTFDPINSYEGNPKLIFMGTDLFRYKKKLIAFLEVETECVKLIPRNHSH